MKTEVFEREDGTQGEKYTPEVGDKFVSRYAYVRENTGGKFTNYSLGVTTEDSKEIYIKVTSGQAKGLKKFGDLTGKTVVFYAYSNDFGDQVGAKVEE